MGAYYDDYFPGIPIPINKILDELGFSLKTIKSIWVVQLFSTPAHHSDVEVGFGNHIKNNISKGSEVIKKYLKEAGIKRADFPRIPKTPYKTLQDAVIESSLGRILNSIEIGNTSIVSISIQNRANLMIAEEILTKDRRSIQNLLGSVKLGVIKEIYGNDARFDLLEKYGDNAKDIIENIIKEYPKRVQAWINEVDVPMEIVEEYFSQATGKVAGQKILNDGKIVKYADDALDNQLDLILRRAAEIIDEVFGGANGVDSFLARVFGSKDAIPKSALHLVDILDDDVQGLTRLQLDNLGVLKDVNGMDVLLDLRFDDTKDLFNQAHFKKVMEDTQQYTTFDEELAIKLGKARETLLPKIYEAVFGKGSTLKVVDGVVIDQEKRIVELTKKHMSPQFPPSQELVNNNYGLDVDYKAVKKVTAWAKNYPAHWQKITEVAKEFVDGLKHPGMKALKAAKKTIPVLAPGDVIIEEGLRRLAPKIVGGVISTAALGAYISYEMALIFMDVHSGIANINKQAGTDIVLKNKYKALSPTVGKDIDIEELYEQTDFSGWGKSFWDEYEGGYSDRYSIGYALTKEIHNKLFSEVYGRITEDKTMVATGQ